MKRRITEKQKMTEKCVEKNVQVTFELVIGTR
jgi:hypothetical protein